MTEGEDTNADLWKSDAVVANWAAQVGDREARRRAQWELMAQLLPYREDEDFTFLDLGAGMGAAAQVLLECYPHAHAVLGEYSPPMIAAGTEAMARFGERARYVEFDMGGAPWPEEIPTALDAVVTSQCVHHLSDERKASLFAELFARLAPGGWYLNYDPVTSDDPVVDAAWQRANERQDPEAAEKARHLSPEAQARHENHVRYMIPLEPQLGYLREAGFEAVDVYWKHLDYVIYGGRRPA
ncbi:MAG TPA: class I SAM-dependent methyltransferase [Acidimicrobiales bacterium]|nr:class I SAM-dependent methyltransferase [Acidimicrobiales bacterium]